MPGKSSLPLKLVLAVGGCLLALGLWLARPGDETLVVYCAHDAVFADDVLRDFERQTGIRVLPRYDTEQTKSLGLVNLLKEEQRNPQCDVFWNNELLGTVDLQQQGVLQPYRGPGYERIPAHFKDDAGHWAGFAARLRVFIVNTEKMPADGDRIAQLLQQGDLSRAAIAKPLFGTTLTHYTLLRHAWGDEKLRNWHHDVHQRGLREVGGNAATKDLVAAGACDFGFTDSDDYFVARDARAPVEMTPARVEGATICIPNSVAIIRGTKRLAAAQKLVDFLLSEETELKLARSASRQVPLGAVPDERLPEDVRPLAAWAREGADLRGLLADRLAVVAWLRTEYLQ
ncbi:MAG: extracellular solute-binding protein [Planctomycetaceae bacterium]